MQRLGHLVVVVGQGHHSACCNNKDSTKPNPKPDYAVMQGLEHLLVVVAQGHHSAGGVQRIRPAAEQLLGPP